MLKETFNNPYPGLRPFEADENSLFFGRDEQRNELLRRLRRTRFLAVVGTSGSGKSSLVRAGLLPGLYGGFMGGGGSRWRITVFRPGDDPIGNLVDALDKPGVLSSGNKAGLSEISFTGSTLRRSNRGLVEVVREADLPSGERLLVVVDQFEELFRFKKEIPDINSQDEATAFVKLLLEAGKQTDIPIYIVITMRSDFLGDCAQFRYLPEAINDGQYLIPRMTRDQRRQAIENPVMVFGARMEARLINRLLNDMGDDSDQLPILQHALMRTWEYWQGNLQDGETIDLPHYEAIGGMENALSRHADNAYDELDTSRKQEIAKRLFKCLTEKGPDNREIRRPTRLKVITAVAEADEEEVIAVIETFRKTGRSFLMPPQSEKLNSDKLIDISHESLIRNWDRLKTWVNDEARSAFIYTRLAQTAVLYHEGKESYLHDLGLQTALDWKGKNRPNENWALRYHKDFDKAIAFLEESREENEAQIAKEEAARQRELQQAKELAEAEAEKARIQSRAAKRFRLLTIGLSIIFILAVISAVIAFRLKKHAEEQTKEVHKQTKEVHKQTKKAQEQTAKIQTALANNHWLSSIKAKGDGDWLKSSHFIAHSAINERDNSMIKNCIYNVQNYVNNTLFLDVQLEHEGSVNGAIFNKDETQILTWSDDGTARLWDADGSAVVKMKHESNVWGAIFNKDETLILTWSEDGMAKLWNARDGSDSAQPMKHESGVNGAIFNKDESLILTWSEDGTARLWNAGDGSEAAQPMKHDSGVRGAIFNKDDQILTWSEDGTARLWNARDDSDAAQFMKHEGSVNGAIFNKEESQILTWSDDGTARLWNAGDGSEATQPMKHDSGIRGAIFNKDDQILTWSEDGTARLWNAGGGSESAQPMKHESCVNGAIFNKDESLILSWSEDGTARLWNAGDGSEFAQPMKHDIGVRGAIFNKDESMILTRSEDGTARLWNARDGSDAAQPMKHESCVNGAIFNKDESLILTWSEDGTARLWNVRDSFYAAQPMIHESGANGAIFNKDESLILTWSADGTTRLWDARDGSEAAQPMKHESGANGAIFNKDESLILTWSADGTARLWDARDGSEAAKMKHESGVNGAIFNKDESLILTWSYDGTARLWDARDGSEAVKMEHKSNVWSAIFNKDESLILTWSYDGTARLWNARDGSEAVKMEHKSNVWSAIFNKDESLILTWSYDGTARLWNAKDGSDAAQPMKHESGVNGAIFNKDESQILTWSNDGTAKLWNARDGSEAAKMKHESGVDGAIFNKEESQILTWSDDGTARLWNAKDGSDAAQPMKHESGVNGAIFNKDESLILTWSDDGTARSWNARDSSDAAQPMKHERSVRGAIFNKDESLIQTWSDDGTVRLWNARDGSEVAKRKHESNVWGAIFNKDESLILTWSYDGTARLWGNFEVDYDFPKEYLSLMLEVVTGTILNDIGDINRLTIGEVNRLTTDDWKKRRAKYEKIAEEHLKICENEKANIYLKQGTSTGQKSFNINSKEERKPIEKPSTRNLVKRNELEEGFSLKIKVIETIQIGPVWEPLGRGEPLTIPEVHYRTKHSLYKSELVRYGKFVFDDASWTLQGQSSCSSCHHERAQTTGLIWDLGDEGWGSWKNTKYIRGGRYLPPFRHEGFTGHPDEIVGAASSIDRVCGRDPGFVFRSENFSPERLDALVAYIRSLEFTGSPFMNEDGSLTEAQKRGWKVFSDPKVGCIECHPGDPKNPRTLFSDAQTHDVGTGRVGRDGFRTTPGAVFNTTVLESGVGPYSEEHDVPIIGLDLVREFDTPTLRDIYASGTYFHDGSAQTLMNTIDNTCTTKDMHGITSHLSNQELQDLVEFMKTL